MSPGITGPTRTWTAICGNREHLCSATGGSGAACSRTAPEDAELAPDTRSAHWLERGFDTEQQTPSVKAHVRIDVRRFIELLARPRADEKVALTMRLLKHRGAACDSLRISLNGSAQSTIPMKVQDEGPTYRIAATVGADFIRELQRPHPSLSVEGCGQLVTVEREAFDTLIAFAKVYSDLATSKELPAASPATSAEQGAP